MSSVELTTARNLLRPFFRNNKPKPYWKQIQQIRNLSSSPGRGDIIRLVESNLNYPFPGMGNTFPDDVRHLPLKMMRRLTPLTLNRELSLQIARINHHGARLKEALSSLSEINLALSSRDDLSKAGNLIQIHIKNFGWSLTLQKKLLLSSVLEKGLTGLTTTVKQVTEEHAGTVWGGYCHHVYDLADPTFDACSAIRHWLSASKPRNHSDHWYTSIFLESVTGTVSSREVAADVALRLGTCSLLDVLLFIWRHGWPEGGMMSSHVQYLDPELQGVLQDRFTYLKVTPPMAYWSAQAEVSDAEMLRMSFFYSDVAEIAEWRSAMNQLILADFDVVTGSTAAWWSSIQTELLHNHLSTAAVGLAVGKSGPWQSSWLAAEIPMAKPHLTYATALAYALKHNVEALLGDRAALAEAIARSFDLQEHIDAASLQSLISGDDDLSDELDFIARDLLFRQFRSRDNDLERRLVLMDLVRRGGGSIAAFIEKVSIDSPAVYSQRGCFCSCARSKM